MAVTRLVDLIQPEVFTAYVVARTEEQSELCRCGMGAQHGARPPKGARVMQIRGVDTRDKGSKWLHHLKIHCC